MMIYMGRCFRRNVTIKVRTKYMLLLLTFWCVYCFISFRLSWEGFLSSPFRAPTAGERNIMFVESSCVQRGGGGSHGQGLSLTARQACAVESTARANPDALVYLLHTCALDERRLVSSPEFVRELFSLHNVFVHHVAVRQFLEGTPLDGWYPNEDLETSQHVVRHGSDMLRLVALWKYGGVYLDLDFVVFKSISSLGINFAGFESVDEIASGILSFQAGHQLCRDCLLELRDRYDHLGFAENGPALLKRVLMRFCDAEQIQNVIPENCRGFKVYPYEYFYAIDFPEVDKFFDSSQLAAEEVLMSHEDSYMIHLWDSVSHDRVVNKSMQQGYGLLAAQYCPSTYLFSGQTF